MLATIQALQKANAAQPGAVPVVSPAVTTQNSTEPITLVTQVRSPAACHNPILVVTAHVQSTTGTGTTHVSDLIRSISISSEKFDGGKPMQIDGPALKYAGVVAAAMEHVPGVDIHLSEAAVDPVITGDGVYEGCYMLPADLPPGMLTVQINMNAFVCAGFTAVDYKARGAYLVAPQRATAPESKYMMPRGQYKAAISFWSDDEGGPSPMTAVVGDGAINYGILGNGSVVLIGNMTNTEIINNVAYWRRALDYVSGTSPVDYQIAFDLSGAVPALKGTGNFSLAVFTWKYTNLNI